MTCCYVDGCSNPMESLGLCGSHFEVLMYPFALPETERVTAVKAVRAAMRRYGKDQKAGRAA